MSSKAIREYDAKLLLAYWLERAPSVDPQSKLATPFVFPAPKVAQVSWDPETNAITPDTQLPGWVFTTKLVAKPDQLIKRRGKAGLLALNKSWEEAKEWISARAGKPQKVSGASSHRLHFALPPHPSNAEYYVCITSQREGDTILFTHEGGVDIGDVDAKALKLDILIGKPFPSREQFASDLLKYVPSEKQATLVDFLIRLYSVYVDLHFAYLEINPLVCLDGVNGADQTADSICGPKWAIARDLTIYDSGLPIPLVWPAPFGRDLTKEEAYIQKLDGSTGASLKLTVLNPEGRIWTMVAGGGASVVYSDAIAAHGFAHELANYGEYSGAPTEGQTYEYAKTIIDLITRGKPYPDGKILIIGGGIANFTNVAATFKGIIRALQEYKAPLINHQVRIYVRRGGPNYQEGLKAMRLLGESLGVPIKVYGPETHITQIVPLALGVKRETKSTAPSIPPTSPPSPTPSHAAAPDSPAVGTIRADGGRSHANDHIVRFETSTSYNRPSYRPFDSTTRSFVYGLQPRAIQGMLDFDYSCGRETPSETLLPVYTSVEDAVKKHSEVDVVVNFASSRSAIAIIAEGVPERHTREILHIAQSKSVLMIGPATVGGIKPGCFKIGNSGGMMDNIIASKLYRPGSVGYVSKSGGMSNELNNILSLYTNGTYEGIAIGGDRYPGTTFIDHLLRYEQDPECKMLILLGEVGGIEEYRVIEAVKEGKIKKPIVAWAIGTCAKMFATEVQFGHAGSMANSDKETADAKNRAMREAGFIVPDTFEDLPQVLKDTYDGLVSNGTIKPAAEREPPVIPMDYKWAQELGLIRKPAAFISTISDERGQELIYAGMRITDVFKEDIGLGGPYLISCFWPLTIGSRFGGALDEAASMFSSARDTGLTPREFVDQSRKANKLISGIGHKIKSVNNPDLRVQLVKEYPFATRLRACGRKGDNAKKDTLILNVDGCIAVCFVDLLRDSGAFTREEADEYIKIGTLNGLFVLGRSIGFIGHHLDQKRLRAPLYRHPADDIFINMADVSQPRVLGRI
ncbi:citrate synthase-like protein [Lactarius quietus]|nr:citrate synthase-like protein [Lactarius quietus]